MVKTRGLLALCIAGLTLATAPAGAAALLSEPDAKKQAVDVLLGDPYGHTPAEVETAIKQTQFLQDGKTKACGMTNTALWEFHVVVAVPKEQSASGVIDGYLALDARSGKLLCANLPFLD